MSWSDQLPARAAGRLATDQSPAHHRRRRGRRTVLGMAVVAVTALASATSFLGDTGTTTPSIHAEAGASSSGGIADVTPINSSVTRGQGRAQLDVGVTLARLAVIPSRTAAMRVSVGWTNASQSGAIFANPNVQLSIGLYHLIATGACSPPAGAPDAVAPQVTLTDTDNATYCGALDEAATGSSVSPKGKLFLTRQIESGYLSPALVDSAAPSALPSCTTTDATWCQPASVTGPAAALYLVASVTVPSGIPVGLQDNISSMTFYVHAAGG